MYFKNFKSYFFSKIMGIYEINLINSNHKILFKSSSKVSFIKKPALFLDRDGVIINDAGFISNPSDVELLPGIKNLLIASKKLGWTNIIVTNQSGIARGFFNWKDYEKVTFKILELLGKSCKIDGIYANGNAPCNELPIDSWRKPNPNMILEASSTFNIDLKNSIIIGDRITDILSGYKAGIKNYVHVLTGHGKKERKLILKKFSKEYNSNSLICINNLLEFPLNKLLKKIF